jgi:TDG/mug DNA glycosylase family protein
LKHASFSFPSVARADARLLLLGALPGKRSLEAQEYFAHKRNAFWPIMGQLFSFDAGAPYAERLERLMENRVALWDVCESAHRPGSLDHRIDLKTVRTNDFAGFLEAHPQIELIGFDGATAARIYRRLVLPRLKNPRAASIPTVCLPSTSPAHAALAFDQKLSIWREALAEFLPEEIAAPLPRNGNPR